MDVQELREQHDAMILQAREWETKAKRLYAEAHIFCRKRVIPAEREANQ